MHPINSLRWPKLRNPYRLVVAALFLLSMPLHLLAQASLSGTVTDDEGMELIGVTVLVPGTTTGAVTDVDGTYNLQVPAGTDSLAFTYTGYGRQLVAIAGRTVIDIVMSSDVALLDEVVVIGYGSVRREDLTGSVSSLTAENFNEGPQLAPQQLIQGKIAGVNISKNSGKPGGSNTVRIRGGTSITASNDPLYVIDGVPISTNAGTGSANIGSGTQNDFFDQEPTNPLMTLNPSDIESVIVLKDASATAIYGSRGANGVIIITTKQGREGQAVVSYDASVGVSRATQQIDMLNASEYRAVHDDLELSVDDRGYDTNWQDEVYRTALQQNHYLSVSGGSSSTRIRASVGYGTQEGVLLSSKLNQASARINVDHSALDDRLNFDLRFSYGRNKSNQSPISNTVGSEFGSSLNYESYVFNPTYPVYNENGSYAQIPPFRVNPVSFSTDITDERTTDRLIGNFATSYKILGPLTAKVNLGYTLQNIDRNSFISKDNPQGVGSGGFANVQRLQDESRLLETLLTYDQSVGRHHVNAIAGYSYQYFLEQGLSNSANGFLSDEFRWYSLQAASNISSVSTFAGSNTLISTYGRVNYDYDNRYFLTATVRRDGSSRFGSGNEWGTFPSAAVAWKITEEDFFQSATVSELKFRISYGITGNQEIGNLNSLTTLGASRNGYLIGGQRVTIVLPEQYANPDLKWEETSQVDVGLTFGLFDHRLYGSIDYYRKLTSDLLLRIAVPSPSVVSTQIANVGSVENQGVELELGAELLSNEDLRWNVNFNLSRNRNKVMSLANSLFASDDIPTAPTQGQGLSGSFAQIIKPGLPIGTFYGPVFTGIDENGLETYADEPAVIGNAQPSVTLGFSNGLTYRSWSLNLNFRGSFGNDVYNGTQNNLGYLSNLPGRNVSQLAVESGVSRDQPKVYSSRWIENGSFLRLDNATVGYRFDMSNTVFRSARIYLTGQNLLLLTSYSGLDPEVNSDVSGSGVAPLGIDYLSYPRAKSLILGANINF